MPSLRSFLSSSIAHCMDHMSQVLTKLTRLGSVIQRMLDTRQTKSSKSGPQRLFLPSAPTQSARTNQAPRMALIVPACIVSQK